MTFAADVVQRTVRSLLLDVKLHLCERMRVIHHIMRPRLIATKSMSSRVLTSRLWVCYNGRISNLLSPKVMFRQTITNIVRPIFRTAYPARRFSDSW
jgi:hypothetical protein